MYYSTGHRSIPSVSDFKDMNGFHVETNSRDQLGESPVWSVAEQALYWVDFFDPTIHCLSLAKSHLQSWRLPEIDHVGSIVLAQDGHLLAATDKGLFRFDPKTGGVAFLADPNRHGRYWVGTYDMAETAPRGILYRLDDPKRPVVADSGYVVCNGPAFSPDDNNLYFSDTIGRKNIAYCMDPASGELSDRRLFFQLPADEGLPDGLAVDAEGCLWLAHYPKTGSWKP